VKNPTTNQYRDRAEQPVLTSLRALIPARELSLAELFALIERQAGTLRALARIQTDVLPTQVVAAQPSFWIEDTELPVSGYSYWDPHRHRWVICLNRDEREASRRFTLLHEFAHILWHGYGPRLFPNMPLANRQRLAEHAADTFAGEALMPKALVTRAHRRGLHTPAQLAEHFGVSTDAMLWKLAQVDLPTPPTRLSSTAEPAIHPRIKPLVEAA
jgi:hypothetical protein